MSAFDRTGRRDLATGKIDHCGVGVLSNYSADAMVGRVARMWRVRDASSTDYVLQNCDSEHGLWEENLRHIPEESHLLIPLGHWLVDV